MPSGISYHSLYSTGEEVLATLEGDGPTWDQILKGPIVSNVWAIQEKWKGRAPNGGDGYGGTTLMGWGFNNYHAMKLASREKTIVNGITNEQLKTEPLFHKPISGPGSALFDGSLTNLTAAERNHLLARGIPSLTLPTGGHQGQSMSIKLSKDNILNMDTTKNGWPRERVNDNDTDWLHSDIKDVAFPFTYFVVDEILKRGDLHK